MKSKDAATATVEVPVDPMTAFEIFTKEIGQWWRPGPINWNDAARAIGMRFEPRVGGRLIEVYDGATGEGLECGRITLREPGVRLVYLYRDAGHEIDDTEVEVRFEPTEGGTRVTVEHRGWEKVQARLRERSREIKRFGWSNILGWFRDWTFWGSPRRVKAGSERWSGH